MSTERGGRKPSKGARKRIRELKSQIRHEFGLTQAQVDSRLWEKTVEILHLELPDFQEKIAPNLSIVFEFFSLRKQINEGEHGKGIDDFYHKHDIELLQELSGAFKIVRRTLTP